MFGNGKRSVWKLTLSYDGSRFAGWQVQPGLPTVQGALAAAILRVTGEHTLPQGSGRTDAGVHALAQVASVALASPVPPQNLSRALNFALPASIRILDACHAPADFHARHSALRKIYEYRVFRGVLCPPWLAPYVCSYTFSLDFAAMQEAAALVVGTHDFRSFQAQRLDAASRRVQAQPNETQTGAERGTVRTLHASAWQQAEPELWTYRVTGSGFLHHMVRNLVGTFFAVGRGQIAAAAIPAILAARSRAAAGPTAPAEGLWLLSVEYPEPVPASARATEAAARPVLG